MTLLHKTVKVVKDYFFALALVATFIGFSAFKYGERFDAPEDGWYPVDITNEAAPDLPTNQLITSSAPITLDGSCQTSHTGNVCAVYLEFEEEGDYTGFPGIVVQAEANNDITVGPNPAKEEEN